MNLDSKTTGEYTDKNTIGKTKLFDSMTTTQAPARKEENNNITTVEPEGFKRFEHLFTGKNIMHKGKNVQLIVTPVTKYESYLKAAGLELPWNYRKTWVKGEVTTKDLETMKILENNKALEECQIRLSNYELEYSYEQLQILKDCTEIIIENLSLLIIANELRSRGSSGNVSNTYSLMDMVIHSEELRELIGFEKIYNEDRDSGIRRLREL